MRVPSFVTAVCSVAQRAARRAALPVLLAGAAIVGAGCDGGDHGNSATRPSAPQFSYTLLDGSQRNTQALRGQVLVVNFWATTCVPCVKEMPQLVATHNKFAGRGFNTLAVAMRYDAPAAVSHFAQQRALPFGVVIDNTGAIADSFGPVQTTPTTFVIDKRGAIARRYVGAPDFAKLQALVDKLLAEAA